MNHVQAAVLRKALAANIRKISAERAIPLNSLADFAGVSRSQLYDVLSARKAATTDWIAKLAEVLEVDPAALLERKRAGAAEGSKPAKRAKG